MLAEMRIVEELVDARGVHRHVREPSCIEMDIWACILARNRFAFLRDVDAQRSAGFGFQNCDDLDGLVIGYQQIICFDPPNSEFRAGFKGESSYLTSL